MNHTNRGGCCLENSEVQLAVSHRSGGARPKQVFDGDFEPGATPTLWCAATPLAETPRSSRSALVPCGRSPAVDLACAGRCLSRIWRMHGSGVFGHVDPEVGDGRDRLALQATKKARHGLHCHPRLKRRVLIDHRINGALA